MHIYLVGGAVRDKLLGLTPKERDYVVVGARPEDMLRLGYKQVGKEFPVFLHPQTGEEYALARMERKVAPGYTGFVFDTSPQVSLEEDLLRRDLTINAMAENPKGELIDPYQGKQDLDRKLLRHVSPAFSEDPVRILRVARFAARYADLGFIVAPETNELMCQMVENGEVDALVPERVWKELERALGEQSPQIFFQILADCGALEKLFPGFDLQGAGMAALKASVNIAANSLVRFACLMYPHSKDEINELCKKYRLPADYRELALLVAQNYQQVLQFTQLKAEQMLDLFSKADVFRREDRFNHLLLSCQVIAICQKQNVSVNEIIAILQVLKAINIKDAISAEQTGPEIAEKVRELRLGILRQEVLKSQSRELMNMAFVGQAVDISDWRRDEEFAQYPEGARDKTLVYCPIDPPFSFLLPGHRYLFKRSSHRYPEQFWVEIIAYHLGCLMDVSVPRAFAAFDRNEQQSGALIEWFYFLQSGTQIYIPGGDFCQQYVPNFDRKKGKQHNFETVIQIFQDLQNRYPFFNTNWKEYWAKAFIFDALIGNTDRHQDNWGIIEKFQHLDTGSMILAEICIAPVFDNGTSMGYNILSNKLKDFQSEVQLEKYYRKGWHHMKWSLDAKKQLGHGELLKRFCEKYPETRNIMLGCLKKVDLKAFKNVLDNLIEIDLPVRLSAERALFILKLIEFRCCRLIKELEI